MIDYLKSLQWGIRRKRELIYFKNLNLNKVRDFEKKGLKVAETANLLHAKINFEGHNSIGRYSKLSGNISIGRYSFIGEFNQLIADELEIGRYCSFGPKISIHGGNHALTSLTTFNRPLLFDGRLKAAKNTGKLGIGNDCWIGDSAIILPGVRSIGDGAIIGAGSIVTRDVAPYSIIVGNPARPIKKRFSDEIITRLLKLKWWDLSEDQLKEIEYLFHLDFVHDEEHAKNELDKCIQKFAS
jgi:virginiamycin A acetyltransferase